MPTNPKDVRQDRLERQYYRIEDGWCGHTAAHPLSAQHGLWACPDESHKDLPLQWPLKDKAP